MDKVTKRTYGLLREKIGQIFENVQNFADAMECDRSTISLKLNGYRFWDQDDMEKSSKLLGFPVEDIPKYFFYEL